MVSFPRQFRCLYIQKKAFSQICALHLRKSICLCNVDFHIFLANLKVSLKTMSKARERLSLAGKENHSCVVIIRYILPNVT